MITVSKNPARNSNLTYTIIPDDELLELCKFFENLFESFLKDFHFPDDTQYSINEYSLIDAIIRVDKREAYFYCFHNMEIHERKKAALYAYWFLKFKPFSLTDTRYIDTKKSENINELFAIYIICSILLYDNEGFNKDYHIDHAKGKKTFTYFIYLWYNLFIHQGVRSKILTLYIIIGGLICLMK